MREVRVGYTRSRGAIEGTGEQSVLNRNQLLKNESKPSVAFVILRPPDLSSVLQTTAWVHDG